MASLNRCYVNVVVPINNQGSVLAAVLHGLATQSRAPDRVVFVFDRCSDNSRAVVEYALSEFAGGTDFTFLDSGIVADGFYGGRVRDIGISACIARCQHGVYLFLDADCVPSRCWIEAHASILEGSERPTVTCGLRTLMNPDGSATRDHRATLFADVPRILLSPPVIQFNYATYTCSLGLNHAAIELARRTNAVLGDVDRVFNSAFDGTWGGEDNFLGLCLFKGDGDVWFIDRKAVVYHQDHPPRASVGSVEQLNRRRAALERHLEDAIIDGRLPGSVTHIARLTCAAGCETLVEDLNFTSVSTPKLTTAVNEQAALLERSRERISIPDDLLLPLLGVVLGRTKRWTAATECRCHELVERSRRYGAAAVALRHWVGQFAWLSAPVRDPDSTEGLTVTNRGGE